LTTTVQDYPILDIRYISTSLAEGGSMKILESVVWDWNLVAGAAQITKEFASFKRDQ
jgi:hypothetical protein